MTPTFPLLYFGNIAYWLDIAEYKKVGISGTFPLEKRTYANRMYIHTANGILGLSIPLVGGRGSKTPYENIQYQGFEWKKKHLTALHSAYAKSPYYDYYIDSIWNIITGDTSQDLFQLNMNLFLHMKSLLNINIEIAKTEDPSNFSYDPNFQASIKSYPQVFRDRFKFQPDLSILDLLFNLGPEAQIYLQKKN